MERKLGWIPKPDERNRMYPLSLALPREIEELPLRKFWQTGPVMDQGDSSMCVGYTWNQWLKTRPLRTLDGPSPSTIYQACKNIDGFPYDDGTTTQAAVKVMQEAGRVKTYLWATNMEELKEFVLLKGPVCVGTWWTEDMLDTNSSGFVKPTGELLGGHAYLCIGYSSTRKAYRFINSWGKYWGQDGRFWIHEDDLKKLLFEMYGEACAAVEQKFTPSV